MKIVIAGAGEEGSHLAKLLSKEEQDVILVDADADKLAAIDANYNLMTNRGSPTSFSVLADSGVGSCDLFIAVTPFETTNGVPCSAHFSTPWGSTALSIPNIWPPERY